MKSIRDYLPNAHPLKRPLPPPQPTPADTGHNYPKATLADVDTTHPDMAKLVATVKKWGELFNQGNKKSIVMVGPNGTGKTLLSRVILWSMVDSVEGIDEEAPVGMMRPATFIIDYVHNKGKIHNLIRHNSNPYARNIPFLIIDDIGVEYDQGSADWYKSKVKTTWSIIIDYCYTRDIPVILSGSNNAGTLPQLADHIGDRAWNRLLQMSPKGFMFDLSRVSGRRAELGGR